MTNKPILPPVVRYGALLAGLLLAIAIQSCGKKLYPILPSEREGPYERAEWWYRG